MVTNDDKAKRIQARRERSGKKGLAIAVKRYLKREARTTL